MNRLESLPFACPCLIVLAIVGHFAAVASAQDKSLLARWPLDAKSTKDAGSHKLDLTNEGADLSAAGRIAGQTAASFDGVTSQLVLPQGALKLGTGEFTFAAWVHTDDDLTDDLGDIVSQYDGADRRGWTLGLRCNTGATSCQSNWRQLQFGIDHGREPVWQDEGRPGRAILAFALCVHDGRLYAGTCEPGAGEAGHVYRYERPGEWTDLGSPDASNSVTALATFRGQLYAATGKYRLGGSSLPESQNMNLGGRVFRLEEERWVPCGQLPQTEAVGGLVVFGGRLYASSLYKPAGFFRYEGEENWTLLPVPDGKRVESLAMFNGKLYASSYDGGRVYRFDGQVWSDLGPIGDNTQTYSFAVHEGRLHVGTWRSGKVFRLSKDDVWEDAGRLGSELEVMGMLVHNGKLYAGTLPLAEVHRYESNTTWTRLKQIDSTPDVMYRRVWTMAQFQGRLFCTTLPSGHVHSMSAGVCVTHDREFPPGWHHVAAVRAADRLRLYVDGERVAESVVFDGKDYDLSNGSPVRIGAGPGDRFRGRLSDVRIYGRALEADEIRRIMN